MKKIYCDGAATMKKDECGNYIRCAGGWGWCLLNEAGTEVVSSANGGEKETTNNRMELMAVYQAINNNDGDLTLYCDSAYVVNIFTQWAINWEKNGWTRGKKHEPIENLDLIKSIYEIYKSRNIVFEKVKGHSTNKFNNFVDELAVKAKKELS